MKKQWLYVGTMGVILGAAVWSGCGDDDGSTSATDNTTSTTNSSSASTGGGGTGGSGTGGAGMCVPEDDCEQCAADECPAEAEACCMATGCQELLICVATNCEDTSDLTCVLNMCGPELDAAGGPTGDGTAAAQAMAPCLTPVLECPEAGSACEACVNSFGMGGAGQGGMCP